MNFSITVKTINLVISLDNSSFITLSHVYIDTSNHENINQCLVTHTQHDTSSFSFVYNKHLVIISQPLPYAESIVWQTNPCERSECIEWMMIEPVMEGILSIVWYIYDGEEYGSYVIGYI